MSIAHVIKQIRALPYSDMMLMASEIRDRVGELTQQKIEAVMLADILARINPGNLALIDLAQEEEKVLRDIFRAKRAMSIQKMDKGWSIGITNIPQASAVGPELRPLFGQMLDQIITMHVLTK